MHLRPFDSPDLSAMATIMATCNLKDSLSLYMNGGRSSTHWLSYRAGCLRWLRCTIIHPGALCWVVETGQDDSLTTQVVGVAVWSRFGTSETAKRWQSQGETQSRKVERMLRSVEDVYYARFPGADIVMDHRHVRNVLPELNRKWDEEIFKEAWELDALFVDPEFQRRGLGTMLINWGLEKSQEEAVPVVVKTSERGLKAYEKNGFKRLRKLEFDQWFEAESQGCWEMVWEPSGGEMRWLERALKKNEERDARARDEELQKIYVQQQRSSLTDVLKDYEVFHSS